MNIFEALRHGNGKATLRGFRGSLLEVYAVDTLNMGKVSEEDLCRNDWLPYVPCETKDKSNDKLWPVYNDCLKKFREIGLTGEQIDKILIKPEFLHETYKHKEVFKDVNSIRIGFASNCPNIERLFNNKATVTLEWEE